MDYYFVEATTGFGPLNFVVSVVPGGTIRCAIGREAEARGVIVCCDWKAQPIDAAEYRRLARE